MHDDFYAELAALFNRAFPSRNDGPVHYRQHPIQVIEFAMINDLNPLEAKVVKYALRRKEDRDIDKAMDCLTKLREFRDNVGVYS